MKTLARLLALLALAGTLAPPILYALGLLGEAALKTVLLAAAVLWFATAPFGLKGGES
jgi:hypothetical protein